MTENSSETDVDTESATPTETEPQPEVDLLKEAEEVAARDEKQASKAPRSLDELDLQGEIRNQVESYVSKAVNEAINKHDKRKTRQMKDDGYMNREQVEQLLGQKEAEYTRREEAKEQFLTTMTDEGIRKGTEEWQEVQRFYGKAVEDGNLSPEILLTPAGIRSVIHMSGVKEVAGHAPGPSSGMPRTAPDGSVTLPGGNVQLNAADTSESPSVIQMMNKAIHEKVNE